MTTDVGKGVPLVRPAPPARWTLPAVGPRASERAVAGLGSLCLKGFLVAQFFSLTRLFFSEHLGDGVTPLASAAGLLSVGLLAVAVLTYGMDAGSPFGRLASPARIWVSTVFTLSVLLFLYGWLVKGYPVTAAAHDLCPYLVIVGAVVLGSIPRAFKDTDRLVIVLFVAALAVNAVGMTEMTSVVTPEDAEDRAGIAILAYRTQGALAFWPLLLLTARLRRPATAFLVFVGVFFVLAQQILFQKRSPTVRILLFMLVFLVVLPRLAPRRRGTAPERRTRGLFVGAGAFAVAVSLGLAPWLFEGQAAGLLHRMSGERYRGGAAAMLTWGNERFFEAGMFLRTLEPEELVLGRGFGGYFVPWAEGWGVWLDDVHTVGRRQLHVGALMPFFKGGLALALVYYAGVGLALVRGWRFAAKPFTAAAFFIVLLHAVFLLQEGWFIMSASFDLVVVGLAMGHLLSRSKGPRGVPLYPWLRGGRHPA